MTKILKIAAATALIAASASASAFWGGGPWGGYPGSSSWMDDFMGDGYGDFNMSMSGGGHGRGAIWRHSRLICQRSGHGGHRRPIRNHVNRHQGPHCSGSVGRSIRDHC